MREVGEGGEEKDKVERRWREGGEKVERRWREGGEKVERRWIEDVGL
jgi:hypothetical protein